MADDRPARPPVGRLLAALSVRRNLAVGAAVGALLGGGLYAVRVLELLGPAPDRGSPVLFLALAAVLALSAGGLVATVLTLLSAVRVARSGAGAPEPGPAEGTSDGGPDGGSGRTGPADDGGPTAPADDGGRGDPTDE